MVNRFYMFRWAAWMLCIVAGIAVSGCDRPPVPAADYRTQYPIAAQEKIFSLIIPVSDQGASAAHLYRIQHFAADYSRRGRGPFLVSQDGGSARFRSMIADLLVKAGVPKHMIFFQRTSENHPGGRMAELSYSGYSVRLPVCGDWSGQAGFDPSNRSHTNFGCSYQRNTGLILANPGDLSVAGDPVERDAPTSDRVIRTYREGKRMGTQAPTLEQKEFSDVE